MGALKKHSRDAAHSTLMEVQEGQGSSVDGNSSLDNNEGKNLPPNSNKIT
jgi:hypothetical protein